ncbi:hypothetical protein PQX77_020053 [Marasmius sp. AFHP31]|nr:hypothetical protein PQX77_020053 [Marasmius sp. AFHP31]
MKSILHITPAARRGLGYEIHELVGRSLVSSCHPSDQIPLVRELKESSFVASERLMDFPLSSCDFLNGHTQMAAPSTPFQLVKDTSARQAGRSCEVIFGVVTSDHPGGACAAKASSGGLALKNDRYRPKCIDADQRYPPRCWMIWKNRRHPEELVSEQGNVVEVKVAPYPNSVDHNPHLPARQITFPSKISSTRRPLSSEPRHTDPTLQRKQPELGPLLFISHWLARPSNRLVDLDDLGSKLDLTAVPVTGERHRASAEAIGSEDSDEEKDGDDRDDNRDDSGSDEGEKEPPQVPDPDTLLRASTMNLMSSTSMRLIVTGDEGSPGPDTDVGRLRGKDVLRVPSLHSRSGFMVTTSTAPCRHLHLLAACNQNRRLLSPPYPPLIF